MNLPPIHSWNDKDFAPANWTQPAAPVGKPRVFVGLCSRDWLVECHTSESVRSFAACTRCEVVFPKYMLNDGVARARNNLTAMFLESDATHLLFLDNDIIMEARHLDCLIEHGVGIVAGFYPKKQAVLDWVVNYLPEHTKPSPAGLLKLKHAGTGCMLISRAVIVDMIEKLRARIEYRGDPGPDTVRWDLFPMHAEGGRYKSEDWFFCEMAQECGHDIWGDFRVQLRHVGKVVYPLQFTLTDDELVDLIYHRYGMWPDHIKTFIASGPNMPGLFGGHRERPVRLWPVSYPVADLHHGNVLSGMFDVPVSIDARDETPVILDIGAGVGAFMRFAAKRWPKCKVICYEGSEEAFPWLQRSAEDKTMTRESEVTVVGVAVTGSNASELPKANLLKIDLPGQERAIVDALRERMGEFDAVVMHYGDATEAFLITKLMEETHLLHCWQRFGDARGVLKFVLRKMLVQEVPVAGPSAL